jgi:hypothetical protein
VTETSGPDHASADHDLLREITEAQAATDAALTSLHAAQEKVDSAHAWGTYDTWFGGGMFSSLAKHARLDEAEEYMSAVDRALTELRKELTDLRMDAGALGGVGVTQLSRALDVWFDNFFTDLGVQTRIKDADHRLDQIGEALSALRQELRHRRAEVEARIAAAQG